MDTAELQASLRRFAAARGGREVYTPKNLTTALMVQAAGLAEVFQWMTAEQSAHAHAQPEVRRRVDEQVAKLFLYVLHVADCTGVDIEQVVHEAMPGAGHDHALERVAAAPLGAQAQSTVLHILLDYENVQPTEAELRAVVPETAKLWVFHGPHQKRVETRFPSYGDDLTPVPISQVGKNALDFHLSFYMGYLVSRNPQAQIVVVANDKGYEPVLAHAREMGLAVRRVGYGKTTTVAAPKRRSPAAKKEAKAPALAASVPATGRATAGKAVARKAVAKKVVAKKGTSGDTANGAGRNTAPRKTAAAKVAAQASAGKAPAASTSAAPKARKAASAAKTAARVPPAALPQRSANTVPAVLATAPTGLAQRVPEHLLKMGAKRPGRLAALRRALKPMLGATASDSTVTTTLNHLIKTGVVEVEASGAVHYPQFATAAAS